MLRLGEREEMQEYYVKLGLTHDNLGNNHIKKGKVRDRTALEMQINWKNGWDGSRGFNLLKKSLPHVLPFLQQHAETPVK